MTTFSSGDLDSHFVYLDLSSRSPMADSAGDSMKKFQTNRIALKCDTVSISTGKTLWLFLLQQ